MSSIMKTEILQRTEATHPIFFLCIEFIDIFCTAKMISYLISCFSKCLLRKLHGKGDRPILCRAYMHVNFRFLLGNLASTEIFLSFPQSFHKVPGMWKLFFHSLEKIQNLKLELLLT